MRKFIAKILLAVFIFNCIPNFGTITLEAAGPMNMTVQFNRRLQNGVANDIPYYNTADVPDGSVYLDFDLVPSFVNPPGGTGVVFSIPVDNTTRVDFTVFALGNAPGLTTGNPQYKVYFDIHKYAGGSWVHTHNNTMEIFYNAQGAYIPAATYHSYAPYTNPETYYVYEEYDGATPFYSFGINPGTGLSLKFENREYHFLVLQDGLTNKFMFTMSGLQDGMIYNYYLYQYDGYPPELNNPTLIEKVRFSTGINYDTLTFIPFVEGSGAVLANPAYYNSTNVKNYDPFVYNNPRLPAENPGLAIRFDKPKEIYYHNHALGDVIGVDGITSNFHEVSLNVHMSDRPESTSDPNSYSNSLQVKIPDLQSVTAANGYFNTPIGTIYDSPHTTPDPSKSFIKELTTDRYEIRLYGLEPSTLFSNIHLDLRVTENSGDVDPIKFSARKEAPLGSAFTFIEFEFVLEDGQYKAIIHPYEGYEGLYNLTDNGTQLQSQPGGPTTKPVIFPITKMYGEYVIYFSTEFFGYIPGSSLPDIDKAVYSQKVTYEPNYTNWTFGSPLNFQVVDHTLSPYSSYPGNYGESGILDLVLAWDMVPITSVQNKLKYESNLSGTAESVTVKYYLQKSIKAEKGIGHTYGEVEVTFHYDPSAVTSSFDGFTIEYNYTIYHPDSSYAGTYPVTVPVANASTFEKNGFYHIEVELEGIEAFRRVPTEDGLDVFFYPNIYWMNAIADNPSIPENASLFDSLTLNDLLESQLFPPVNLTHDPDETDNNQLKAVWTISGDELQRYIDGLADINNQEFTVNMFISTNEDKMKALAGLATPADRNAYAAVTAYTMGTMGAGGSTTDIHFSGAPLDDLRDYEKIVRITGIEMYTNATDKSIFFQNLNNGISVNYGSLITGLDPNQTYYMFVTLQADNTFNPDSNSGSPVSETVESSLSNLHGVTTRDDPSIPDGEDKRPPAPVLNVKDVGIDKATVYWDYAYKVSDPSEEVYYQIIRTKNDQMDIKYIDSYMELEDFYTTLQAEMSGIEIMYFRTNDTDLGGRYAPDIYNGSTYTHADPAEYELLFGDQTLEFIDRQLSSNQIYFYYVRTVRVVNGVANVYSYSAWNYISATTDTLAPPINLQIDQDASYDEYTEFVFSFDAPMAHVDMLGTEYEVEYQLKKDNDEYGEVTVLNTATLKNNYSKSDIDGYIHFQYKITGLEAGTQYAIRIRMSSLTSTDKSSWTMPAITRTGIIQEDLDNKNTADAWMEFYKTELELLMKKDYWTYQDTSARFGAVYRPTMFSQVISKTAGGQIPLPVGSYEDTTYYTYYVPAASYDSANIASKGFVLTRGNTEVVISPGTISTQTNETLITITEQIRKTNIKDYYIMISLEFQPIATVNDQPSISDNVIIDIQAVGSRELTVNWDNEILAMYLNMIQEEANNQTIRTRVYNMLSRNNSAADIESYILDKINDKRLDMIKKVDSSHRTNTRTTYSFDVFDKSIIIAVNAADETISANGFKHENGAWNAIETFVYKAGKGFYTNTPGSYIFAGVVVNIPGLTTNAGTTYGIVAKYNLTDFLGVEGNIDINSAATRSMVLNSVARMMGAPVGSDPVMFLKAKGYTVSGANTVSVATSQESVYLVMAVYEVKTGTKVNTIQIRNYLTTAAITGIDDRYKKSIQAAFELGIYTNTAMQPKAGISIKELLDMLTALDNRANL